MSGANNTQVISSSQKYSTAGKKGNNSIDLGSRATTNMNTTHGNKFGNSTQYVRAYTQSPGSVASGKMNTI